MSYANLLLNILYHIVIEMNIRESCLQTGTFIYKPGISVTKQDFHLQTGILGLQMGFSGYYLPIIYFKIRYTYCQYNGFLVIKQFLIQFHVNNNRIMIRILKIQIYSFYFVHRQIIRYYESINHIVLEFVW